MVKDIKEELTEEQLKQLELDERKEKYKKLQHFLQSDACTTLCDTYTEKWESLVWKIKDKISNRKETKSNRSQLDKDVAFQLVLEEFIDSLWDMDGENVLRGYFIDQVEAIETNILNKVSHEEELYDLPFYTDIDILKQIRMDYCTLHKRISAITASFADKKEEQYNPNPYEEVKMSEEEFNALTDTN